MLQIDFPNKQVCLYDPLGTASRLWEAEHRLQLQLELAVKCSLEEFGLTADGWKGFEKPNCCGPNVIENIARLWFGENRRKELGLPDSSDGWRSWIVQQMHPLVV